MRLQFLATFIVLLAPVPALAQGTPRSIGECERLKNDLAYNQCLAMFGPAAQNVAGGFASADTAPPPAAALAQAIPQVDETAESGTSGRRRYRSSHRSRQYASFSTGYRHRRRR